MNKANLRSIQGAIFSLGAPLGWLGIQSMGGANIFIELQNNLGLYTYLLFATLIVFTAFGHYVGNKEQIITELATRDPLTGAYNLRHFIERMDNEISRANRDQSPLSIIYLDLDFFKKINDQYGHPAGDKVLIKLAEIGKNNIRNHDIFSRVGGEEFAILLPHSNLDDAITNAERIRQSVADTPIPISETDTVSITLSAGVVEWKKQESAQHFYKRADEKLYEAKLQGRNRVCH